MSHILRTAACIHVANHVLEFMIAHVRCGVNPDRTPEERKADQAELAASLDIGQVGVESLRAGAQAGGRRQSLI